MGRSSSHPGSTDYDEQADIIKDMLLGVPRTWSGVFHCTSKVAARDLAQRLAQRGFSDRVWLTPEKQGGRYLGTDQQLQAWFEQRTRHPNSLCVAWSFWEGIDLLDERICVIAKVPFPNIGDEYERQRMMYNPKFYNQRTAWRLEQGSGRTRRGREQDYDLDGKRRGLVAIVDGNWTRVQSYMSASFREAIVEW